MNFTEFKESHFFYAGRGRYNVINHSFNLEDFAMFDSYSLRMLSSKDPTLYHFGTPWHKRITTMHLIHALEMRTVDTTESNWMPEDFRELIKHQWIEVSDILNSILDKEQLGNPNKKNRILHSKLLITEPGVPIMQHVHDCPQTLTVCYKLSEDKLNSTEPSHFKMGKDMLKNSYFPDSDKFIFTMVDDPPHQVHSNEWRFWWFNDFSDYFELPKDLPFYYWNDPLLDNNNLDKNLDKQKLKETWENGFHNEWKRVRAV